MTVKELREVLEGQCVVKSYATLSSQIVYDERSGDVANVHNERWEKIKNEAVDYVIPIEAFLTLIVLEEMEQLVFTNYFFILICQNILKMAPAELSENSVYKN